MGGKSWQGARQQDFGQRSPVSGNANHRQMDPCLGGAEHAEGL